jgi:hypothetical protein
VVWWETQGSPTMPPPRDALLDRSTLLLKERIHVLFRHLPKALAGEPAGGPAGGGREP